MAIEDDIEQRWIAAWNDLYEIVGELWDAKCQLPNYQIVDAEACRGWLQEMVYTGWFVKVERGWVLGKEGIIASMWR